MIDMVQSALVGVVVSFIFATAVEFWKARGRRRLVGTWWSAVQPVYYGNKEWHIQQVSIRTKIVGGGMVVKTRPGDGKLQWSWEAKLVDQKYLVGRWKSTREGAVSKGYMSVQISSNGKYMCGHDYGDVAKNMESHFGVLLLGRSREDLETARKAMTNGERSMLSLAKQVDFDENRIAQVVAEPADKK